MKDEDYNLSLLYRIPKLHKCSYEQRYIVGVTKCSTKLCSCEQRYIVGVTKCYTKLCLYEQRYIVGATKCYTKLLSKISTSIFVKTGLQKYHIYLFF
jgi:hypothetical protein